MATDNYVHAVVNVMTKNQYETLATKNANEFYFVTDEDTGAEKQYFRHHLKLTANDNSYYADLPFSSNLKIDSLQDLSTVTGQDEFFAMGPNGGAAVAFVGSIWIVAPLGTATTYPVTAVTDEVTLI